jgi:hypothetical protein
VARLGKAKREGTLDRLLADVAKARLLVLDEFGPVPFDVDGARQLYQVMPEGHGRRGAAFATSVESGRRGTDFADKRLAAAIVDRVVHHGRLVEFGGSSRRLEESSMLGKGARRRPRGSSRGRPPTWRKARFASGRSLRTPDRRASRCWSRQGRNPTASTTGYRSRGYGRVGGT